MSSRAVIIIFTAAVGLVVALGLLIFLSPEDSCKTRAIGFGQKLAALGAHDVAHLLAETEAQPGPPPQAGEPGPGAPTRAGPDFGAFAATMTAGLASGVSIQRADGTVAYISAGMSEPTGPPRPLPDGEAHVIVGQTDQAFCAPVYHYSQYWGQLCLIVPAHDSAAAWSTVIFAGLIAALFLAVVAAVMVVTRRRVILPLSVLADKALKLADGDLSAFEKQKLAMETRVSGYLDKLFAVEVVERLTESLTRMVQSFQEVISYLKASSSDVGDTCAQLASTAKQSQATAAEQSATIAELGATVREIRQTSEVVVSQAQDVLDVAENAVEGGQRGIDAITAAASAMALIQQISDIVDTVNELAEQSNLLAVNASIEAAKAGEVGRGFSVVASEVRSLAIQSKKAARQIRDILQRTETGLSSISSAKEVIEELAAVLEDSSDRARQISAAASQQATGIAQIADAMDSLIVTSKHNADAAGQLDASADSLSTLTEELQLGLARFNQ